MRIFLPYLVQSLAPFGSPSPPACGFMRLTVERAHGIVSEHSLAHRPVIIELWTEKDGPGKEGSPCRTNRKKRERPS
ncbi:protein of unknown function [Candidatus Nitrospira inopinata]|uniref:Uncharacterized protein n=1 Tax=Candidatus Nitrospira inopinata TaxID=1715989 RepID=A0A0S4KN58_9BACT|nr:protein of unknown function [Candidatus Nitrospira inopinata]